MDFKKGDMIWYGMFPVRKYVFKNNISITERVRKNCVEYDFYKVINCFLNNITMFAAIDIVSSIQTKQINSMDLFCKLHFLHCFYTIMKEQKNFVFKEI